MSQPTSDGPPARCVLPAGAQLGECPVWSSSEARLYWVDIDGRAIVESRGGVNRLTVTPTRAVFHRHGPAPDPTSSCAADCLPVLETAAPLTITPPR